MSLGPRYKRKLLDTQKTRKRTIAIVIEFCMASDNLSLTPDSAFMDRTARLTTTINTILLAYFTWTHFNIILVTLCCNFNRLQSNGTPHVPPAVIFTTSPFCPNNESVLYDCYKQQPLCS